MAAASASISPLAFPDGSTSYTSPTGASEVLASVNGPIDFHRRDAQRPDEAAVEVLVKPSVGQSSIVERHAESIVRGVLGRIILKQERFMARSGIVVTLLVTRNKTADPGSTAKVSERGESCLAILPSLLNAALLALVSAAVPLSMTYASILVAASPTGTLVPDPSPQDIKAATSLHVFAYTTTGQLLLAESEGEFDMDIFDAACNLAEARCVGGKQSGNAFIRDVVEDKLREELSWKISAKS